MENKKCKGLLGLLLGHHYEAVYDVDKEYKKPEDLTCLVNAAAAHNFWNFTNPIKVDTSAIQRITKVYVKHVCTRCGNSFDAKLKL